MTISATNRKNGPYTTNGVTTNFAYTFQIAADDELEVYKLNTSTDTEELLTLDSDYTVTGAGDAGGGNVVISPALGSGFEITIKGVVDLSQETDFDNQGGWHPNVHEAAFDKLTKIVIDLQEQLDRCLKINVTDTPNGSEEFDPATADERFVKRLADGSFTLATFVTGITTGTVGYGDTASRPAGLGVSDAMQYVYYDTDLGYPIFWNGTSWSTFSGVAGV